MLTVDVVSPRRLPAAIKTSTAGSLKAEGKTAQLERTLTDNLSSASTTTTTAGGGNINERHCIQSDLLHILYTKGQVGICSLTYVWQKKKRKERKIEFSLQFHISAPLGRLTDLADLHDTLTSGKAASKASCLLGERLQALSYDYVLCTTPMNYFQFLSLARRDSLSSIACQLSGQDSK